MNIRFAWLYWSKTEADISRLFMVWFNVFVRHHIVYFIYFRG